MQHCPITGTPKNCFEVRRCIQRYKKDPQVEMLDLIFKASLKLASKSEILQHQSNGLIWALKQEKKKRSRGKPLNLLGEADSGPTLFSPSKVQAAKMVAATKLANEQAENEKKVQHKIKQAAKKEQAEKEKAERAVARLVRAQVNAEIKAQKKAETEARKLARLKAADARKAVQLAKKGPRIVSPKKPTVRMPRKSTVTVVVEEGVPKSSFTTARGRRTARPTQLV